MKKNIGSIIIMIFLFLGLLFWYICSCKQNKPLEKETEWQTVGCRVVKTDSDHAYLVCTPVGEKKIESIDYEEIGVDSVPIKTKCELETERINNLMPEEICSEAGYPFPDHLTFIPDIFPLEGNIFCYGHDDKVFQLNVTQYILEECT